ncbi:MAG TPA: hypothetical protein VK395_24775 [Gemmataceae bacterium]|nr:hypothetical protein [Gemmataceae bacterium]
MESAHDDQFAVYLRQGCVDLNWPERAEEPLIICPSYQEARRVLRLLRNGTREGVIRFVGAAGGGD